jgi:hypothetical protein
VPALIGPAVVAAVLLAVAGAQKLVDPAATSGALRALSLPWSPLLVRVGSTAEVVLGAAAIVVGGPVAWGLVALSYVAFGLFVLAALRKGTMIGSCGCFGREDTPPHLSHGVLNGLLAAIGVAAALSLDGAVVDHLADHPAQAVLVAGLAAVATYLAYAVFVELPRTLTAGKP